MSDNPHILVPTEVTPVPPPLPTPTPSPLPTLTFWQILKLLFQNLFSKVTGFGKRIRDRIGGRSGKAIQTSLLVLILVSILSGYVGGRVAAFQGEGSIWSWFSGWHWPIPTPKPPVPPPSPAPIPVDGLHVLVVGDEAKMTKDQINALKSTELRTYLNSVCPKGPDGKTPEYRFWPTGLDVTNESQVWKDAYARVIGKPFPWIIVSNPSKGGFEGPLPADLPSILALVKRFGG